MTTQKTVRPKARKPGRPRLYVGGVRIGFRIAKDDLWSLQEIADVRGCSINLLVTTWIREKLVRIGNGEEPVLNVGPSPMKLLSTAAIEKLRREKLGDPHS